MNAVSIPIITALVFVLVELYKMVVGKEEKYTRLIPVIGIVLGMILAVIAFYTIEDMIPATNYFEAILIGAVSGAAATGAHQVLKQLTKNSNKENT